MKNAYNYRLRLVESACQRGINSTARLFAATVRSVRKWLRRDRQHGPSGMVELSCAAHHQPRKTPPSRGQQLLELRPTRLTLGAETNLPCRWFADTCKVIKEDPLGQHTNLSKAQLRSGMRMSLKCLSRNSRDLFVTLPTMGSRNQMPRFREMGWRGMDSGRRLRNIRERISARILKRAEKFRSGQGRLMKRAVMLQHPTRQHGFGCFLNPLVHQNRDFTAQIGGVIQPSQLKTLQRGTRSRAQVVDWRTNAGHCHT